MAKIKYLRAHFGIQPGTVVDEHRPEVVAKLTKVERVFDPDTKTVIELKPIAELTDEPATADLERKALKPAPANKAIKGDAVLTK